MKVLIVLALALSASAYVVPENQDASAYGYIQKHAIPLADKIRIVEDQMRHGRIVGGSPAALGQFPYQAGLIASYSHTTSVGVCGGSLVSADRIITAAHCWFDGFSQATEFTAVLGSTTVFYGGTRIPTNVVVMHQDWMPLLIRNDIAVVYMPEKVTFSDTISPIALPSGSEIDEDFVGVEAVASGYGLTSDGGALVPGQFLSYVNLGVISNTDCRSVFSNHVFDSIICTLAEPGKNICSSDSGGPLATVRNDKSILIGVVSFGGRFCEGGLPSGYARVTYYLDFIKENL